MKLTRSERKERELNIKTVYDACKYIGKQCAKFSGKPFKSGNKINTITGAGEIIGEDGKKKIAFCFAEDKTYVSCQMVYIID